MTHSTRIPYAAWLTLFLGLTSLPFFPLGLVTLVYGMRTLREINSSDGAQRGARLTQVGLLAALCGLALPVIGLFAILMIQLQMTSRRAECTNHLRQIGLALNKYCDHQGTFPPATRTPSELPYPRRLSWMADLLPLLASDRPVAASYLSLSESLDRQRGWDDPANTRVEQARIGLFHCPAHPGPVSNATHYVGMTGVGINAIELPRGDLRAGLFGNDLGVRRAEVTAGISVTMMVLETGRDNGPWLAGGFPTARGLDPLVEHYAGPGRPFGGLHRGLVNILWVDGSVRPLSEETPGALFRQQVTIQRDVQ